MKTSTHIRLQWGHFARWLVVWNCWGKIHGHVQWTDQLWVLLLTSQGKMGWMDMNSPQRFHCSAHRWLGSGPDQPREQWQQMVHMESGKDRWFVCCKWCCFRKLIFTGASLQTAVRRSSSHIMEGSWGIRCQRPVEPGLSKSCVQIMTEE